jgi:hypothetical protein
MSSWGDKSEERAESTELRLRGASEGGASFFEGISMDQSDNEWHAKCYCLKTQNIVTIGSRAKEEEAARAYTDYVLHLNDSFTSCKPPCLWPSSARKLQLTSRWRTQVGNTSIRYQGPKGRSFTPFCHLLLFSFQNIRDWRQAMNQYNDRPGTPATSQLPTHMR